MLNRPDKLSPTQFLIESLQPLQFLSCSSSSPPLPLPLAAVNL
nr:MAG TPA: hypothetical protein [Caudoviricetes sp.]